MRVLIVDDHPLIVEGLAASLSGLDASLQIATAGDGGSALRRLAEGPRPDLLLLDLNLPDAQGLDLLARLRDEQPEVPVVLLSAQDQPDTVRAALAMGAMGFISKRAQPAVVLRALQLVLSGGVYVPPEIFLCLPAEPVASAAQTPAQIGIAGRQLDVLSLLVEGLPNKLISRRLGIAPATVKSHLAAIFRTLRVNNRAQVLIALSRLGVQLPILRGQGERASSSAP